MENIGARRDKDTLIIELKGHIDSANAGEVEKEINACKESEPCTNMIIDAKELKYISSAGLRVILRLKKEFPDLKVINASSEVYEIFDITGFAEMMTVEKAYREISVEGCEVIGQGANGKVYRIDPDTIVKVYLNPDSLPDIQRERELARTALILGIPTAIPYDVVKVGEGYGSVFELLNAKSFAKLLANNLDKLDEVVKMSVDLLKKIHSTEVKPGIMPDMKAVALDWVEFLQPYLPEDKYNKLHRLVDEVPQDFHMMHGDYHIKNVMMQNDEVLLIDMDTLCTGHPIFEFASIFNAYQGYAELDHKNIESFLGIPYEAGKEFWEKTLKLYFADRSDEEIKEIEKKAKLIGYTRIMRRSIRRGGLEDENGKAVIENCKNHILELLDEVDSLVF